MTLPVIENCHEILMPINTLCHSYCGMQVIVSSPNKPCPYSAHLPESYIRIGRALVGGHPETIAKAVLNHAEMREALIIQMVDTECSILCRNGNDP